MGEKNLLQDKAELHDDSKHMKLIKDARTESIYENLVNWMNGLKKKKFLPSIKT